MAGRFAEMAAEQSAMMFIPALLSNFVAMTCVLCHRNDFKIDGSQTKHFTKGTKPQSKILYLITRYIYRETHAIPEPEVVTYSLILKIVCAHQALKGCRWDGQKRWQ